MALPLPALLFCWASLASGEAVRAPGATGLGAPSSPMIVSQDPLIQEIRSRQLTQPNGGIRAAVRIGSGQTIELKVSDLGDLPVLKPAPGLVAASAADKKRKPARKADEQLRSIETQGPRKGWAESKNRP